MLRADNLSMISRASRDVVAHYTARHEFRGDLFGGQPFANYGYWPRPDLTLEEAAEELTELVARTAGIGPDDRVLDVGCGYGANAVSYVRRHHPASVTGIDITDVRIDSGRDYVARNGLDHIVDLRLGDATHMEFPDASFTKVIGVECAFHFDTRRDFMREAFRVLRPGGALVLTDLIPRAGIDPHSYQTGEPATASGICLDMPVNAYDAEAYRRYLGQTGFTGIRIESILQQTRVPFANALQRAGENAGGERGRTLCNVAARLRRIIAQGEDYVLVVAHKPA